MAYGILAGLGEGMSKVADNMNSNSMTQYKMAVEQDMEQRIYERGRADSAADRAAAKADAKDLALFKHKLDKDDPAKAQQSELDRLKVERAKQELIEKKYQGKAPEELAKSLETLKSDYNTQNKMTGFNGSKAQKALREQIAELEYALSAQTAATAKTSVTEEKPDPLDPDTTTTVKKTTQKKIGMLADPNASQGSSQNGLPPGSVQVGTSGGKPVYETPDGRRLIAE